MPKIYTNGIEQEMTPEQVSEFETAQAEVHAEVLVKLTEVEEKNTAKASGRQKLIDLGLTEEEINNLNFTRED
tara:strand:+ start:351 stop:569 length:219 start_codon:yes stop_codon:yes gene_type:complete